MRHRVWLSFVLFVLCVAPARDADTFLDVAQRFEGTWTCKTDLGSFAIRNFRIDLDQHWLTVHDRYEMPGGATGAWDEYYGYTPATHTWLAVVFGSTGIFEMGTSPGWSGTSWRFVGTMSSQGRSVPWRMTYTKFGDTKLQRTHELQTSDGWQKTSGETCERR